jgi:5-methylcytosine-specific restriction endonuclease McrA
MSPTPRICEHGEKASQCPACRKAYFAAYYQKNADRIKERSRQWRQDNPDRKRENDSRYYQENREKALEQGAERYQRNRERHLELSTRWRKNNPERRKQIKAKWYQNNKEIAFQQGRRRRARLRGAPTVPYTVEQLRGRWAYYGHKCWVCSEPATEIDHVKPIAKGGAEMLCNLRPICRSCNASKCDKWPYVRASA